MDNKLISKGKLFPLVCEWIEQVIARINGYQNSFSKVNGFYWTLTDSIGSRYCAGGADLKGDHWDIFNEWYDKEHVNIKIFDDHIEFIEDSVFKNISKDEMYDLYTFLNERIFGNKEEENNNASR